MSDPVVNSDIAAAMMLIDRLGVSIDDLHDAATLQRTVPTFAEYIPIVYNAMPATATRDTYMSYWQKLWPNKRLDEPTVTDFKALIEATRQQRRITRNDRGGRVAVEHFYHALRCLYRFAIDDRYIARTNDPSARLDRPRTLPSNRRALPNELLAQINCAAAQGGNDPHLDALLLRLHTETACRLGGALALRIQDLDPVQSVILLREKGQTERWQPVTPTLMAALQDHYTVRIRSVDSDRTTTRNGRPLKPDFSEYLLRYRSGMPISKRRYDLLWERIGRSVPPVATHGVTTHWLRHTTLRWVERNFGHSVAKAFAGHSLHNTHGATTIYTRAGIEEVATALAAMTGEPHPLATGPGLLWHQADQIPFDPMDIRV
ncbi:tyrosine-type recombinase/integrase [Nocardia huaxiensis]|uniref:Site-specific integrase n=1 Tax=Nocardia huaxiensis TaxID=2755382 RepID=A0A7D6V6J7_9NOCA|nr:site-specific integrase [Nocardia huaxiensis]QLY28812.1 site-specific integrase [Nocardia huaxiensis]UFS97711.1 site-specific integrase [Nocardia huaxiensis]